MAKWISDHQLLIMAGFLLLLNLFVGYAAFIDGHFIRKPAMIMKHASLENGCVTHITTKQTYQKGEMVEAVVNIEKYRNVEASVQWNLMDARYYPYAARKGSVPVGKHNLQVPIERIPTHIPPGEYYFSGIVQYGVNPISDVFMPIKTNKFMVTE